MHIHLRQSVFLLRNIKI